MDWSSSRSHFILVVANDTQCLGSYLSCFFSASLHASSTLQLPRSKGAPPVNIAAVALLRRNTKVDITVGQTQVTEARKICRRVFSSLDCILTCIPTGSKPRIIRFLSTAFRCSSQLLHCQSLTTETTASGGYLIFTAADFRFQASSSH